jgi:hypothetical protein
MKNFSTFLEQSTRSLATIQGKRLGLVPDGHGGYHNKKTGEFIAKNEGGRLKFYNQNQILGQPDPPQVRSLKNQQIASTQVIAKKKVREEYIDEKQLREKYIAKEIYNEGDIVRNLNTGVIGKIIRRGTNHLICVTEDDHMFKSWIRDVQEWTEVSGVPAKQREVGTDAYRKYAMKMTDTKKIKNFINKYKAN